MELKFLPYSMFAEGYVSDDHADILEKYALKDIEKIKGEKIKSDYHNFLTTSEDWDKSEDNIKWEKYKNILSEYVSFFIQQITDKIEKFDMNLYMNYCKKNSFISPHFDRHPDDKICFMMIYCPLDYDNKLVETTYLNCEKYHTTFNRFEKLPGTGPFVSLKHQRGKFYIVPSNLLHWVSYVGEDIDRVTVMSVISF